jgi:hypothetical protein
MQRDRHGRHSHHTDRHTRGQPGVSFLPCPGCTRRQPLPLLAVATALRQRCNSAQPPPPSAPLLYAGDAADVPRRVWRGVCCLDTCYHLGRTHPQPAPAMTGPTATPSRLPGRASARPAERRSGARSRRASCQWAVPLGGGECEEKRRRQPGHVPDGHIAAALLCSANAIRNISAGCGSCELARGSTSPAHCTVAWDARRLRRRRVVAAALRLSCRLLVF